MSVNNNLKAISSYFSNREGEVLSVNKEGELISKPRNQTTSSIHIHVPYGIFDKETSFHVDIEIDSSTETTADNAEKLVKKALLDLEKTSKPDAMDTRVIKQLNAAHRDDTNSQAEATARSTNKLYKTSVGHDEGFGSAAEASNNPITSEENYESAVQSFLTLKTPKDLGSAHKLYQQGVSLSKQLAEFKNKNPDIKIKKKTDQWFEIQFNTAKSLFAAHLSVLLMFIEDVSHKDYQNAVFRFTENGEIQVLTKKPSHVAFVVVNSSNNHGIYCEAPNKGLNSAAIMRDLIEEIHSSHDADDPVKRYSPLLQDALDKIAIAQKK